MLQQFREVGGRGGAEPVVVAEVFFEAVEQTKRIVHVLHARTKVVTVILLL